MSRNKQQISDNSPFEWEKVPESPKGSGFDDIDSISLDQQKKKRYEQNTLWRERFSLWVMWIIPIWLIFVLIIIILVGSKVLTLPTSSINVLLGTTTLNVLGLSYIVLKGMFPSGRRK